MQAFTVHMMHSVANKCKRALLFELYPHIFLLKMECEVTGNVLQHGYASVSSAGSLGSRNHSVTAHNSSSRL